MVEAKFAISPLGKAFEKQTEKQVGALKSLDLSNKKYELKQIEGIFPKRLMNGFNRVKLKEIVNPIRHWGMARVRHIVSVADCFVCCGSIRDLEKMEFLENS